MSVSGADAAKYLIGGVTRRRRFETENLRRHRNSELLFYEVSRRVARSRSLTRSADSPQAFAIIIIIGEAEWIL